MERETIWVGCLKSENGKKGITSWNKCNIEGMRMLVADANDARVPAKSYGHIPAPCTLALPTARSATLLKVFFGHGVNMQGRLEGPGNWCPWEQLQSVINRDFVTPHVGQLQGLFSTISRRYPTGLILSSPEWLMLIKLSYFGFLPYPDLLVHYPDGIISQINYSHVLLSDGDTVWEMHH